MIELKGSRFTQILPYNLSSQTQTRALAYAIGIQVDKLLVMAERMVIWADLDRVPEQLLDYLAAELRTPSYSEDYPVQVKRDLIQKSFLFYTSMGTPWAVDELVKAIFGNGLVEEWNEYGGQPYHFRLTVDVTRMPVTARPVEEVDQLLRDIKRRSAWLDQISYMIRSALEIGHRVEAWAVSPPLCGTIRCGTWWMPSTLGWSENRTVQAAGRAEGFEVWPELTGTLPEISTVGYSACGAVRCGGQVTGREISPPPADTVKCGTEWMPATLGWSAAGTMQAAAEAEANLGCPDLAGTLPTVSKIGYSVTVPAEAGADAQLHTTELPESGTSPCGMKP